MEASIWGPKAWVFLHSITMNYPEKPTDEDKRNFDIFFSSIGKVLPCKICKKHYENNLKINPINLNSKKELVTWLINIHNEVNKLNNKKIYTYDEVIKLYETIYKNNKNKDKDINNLKLNLDLDLDFDLISNNLKNTIILSIKRVVIPLLLAILIYYLIKNNTKLLN